MEEALHNGIALVHPILLFRTDVVELHRYAY